MSQTNAIIITILLSVVLGACGFFGMRYLLTRDAADNPGNGVEADVGDSGGGLFGNSGSLFGQSSGSGENQKAPKPSKDYPHPIMISASAVISEAETGTEIPVELSVTFRNDSPLALGNIEGMLYAIDSDYDISPVSGQFGGDWSDLPEPVQPGETVTFIITYRFDSWTSTIDYFENDNVRIGILWYGCEDGNYHSITGSFSAYADISGIFMVPVVVSDQR